jgi:hypothetical protein
MICNLISVNIKCKYYNRKSSISFLISLYFRCSLMLYMTSAGRISNVACKHKYNIFIEIGTIANYLFSIHVCLY